MSQTVTEKDNSYLNGNAYIAFQLTSDHHTIYIRPNKQNGICFSGEEFSMEYEKLIVLSWPNGNIEGWWNRKSDKT